MAKSEKKKAVKKSTKEGSQPSTSDPPAGNAMPMEQSDNVSEQQQAVIPEAEKSKTDFDSRYLRHFTREFADDLDKLRKAPDFTEQSVPILLEAIKMCGDVYTEEQKRILMGEDE